jgi:hypothetical protein
MPKNTVSDPITDQEMAFAHLIMSGTMNDRRAAEAVGLNPGRNASTGHAIAAIFVVRRRTAATQSWTTFSRDGAFCTNCCLGATTKKLNERASLYEGHGFSRAVSGLCLTASQAAEKRTLGKSGPW